MSSLMRLLLSILADASIWCDASTTRDFETITRRVEDEGLSFVTITLPAFCSDFERSLDKGMVDSSCFLGFKRHGALPRFLGGLLSRIFDSKTGNLLDNPCVDSIFFVRQITLVFKKIELDCTPSRTKKAYKGFIECEKELKHVGKGSKFKTLRKEFSFFARALWASRLARIDSSIYNADVVPRHGPGAVAERIKGNFKYAPTEWHARLERVFPFCDFGIANYGFTSITSDIEFLEPGAERPVRVVTVPKTMKTPRIIAIEPLCMQYTQQGLLELLVPELTHLTCGSLNFKSQEKNQQLALSSSKSGSHATLDLSEASDRVHSALVWDMLASAPNLRRAVFACRTTRADVPGHGIIPLVKFASMGSALCFPIESMVFLTILLKAWCKAKGTGVSEKEIHSFFKDVCVYGDDIIVPTDMVSSVVSELSVFGLKVNVRKSFYTGKFRESCGLDAYDGVNVKPVYIRRLPPTQRHDALQMVSWVNLSNQLYERGLWKSAKVAREIAGEHPTVSGKSGIIGYTSYIPLKSIGRWNTDLHRWETRGHKISVTPPSSAIDGHAALMKFFLKRGSEPHFDVKHLERYGRPDCVRTKIRWGSPV